MPHLSAAIAAIEAEIAHTKQGLAHFLARVEALEKTIAHLVAIDYGTLDEQPSPSDALAEIKAVKAKAIAAKPTKAATKVKAAEPAKGGNKLPYTGGDFWLNLVTANPQSGAEILHAAIAKLGFKPTWEQVLKLTQRATFAIHTLVKAGKIKDTGKGRERRFFRE